MSEDGRDESCADDDGPRQVPGQARAPLDDIDGAVPAQRDRREQTVVPLPVRPPSDADLIARMRWGDDTAYAELYRRHAGAVRRYARTCCRNAHTADELTGEVFARMLHVVRGGLGPEHAVRACLLTSVRRVAAAWVRSAGREHLVDGFADFVTRAPRASNAVDAMHEAEQSLAMQAFRSLPERWQAVLWHTEVEDESPGEIAALLGLDADGVRVLAGRAREALKQAFLQAHASAALAGGDECARYAGLLCTYARGRLRKHLTACARCRLATGQLQEVASGIPAVVPVAVIGWLGPAGYAKVAGLVDGGGSTASGSRRAGFVAGVVAVAAAVVAIAIALSGAEREPAEPRAAAPSSPVVRQDPPPRENHPDFKPPPPTRATLTPPPHPPPLPKPTRTPTPAVPARTEPSHATTADNRTTVKTHTSASSCALPTNLTELTLSLDTPGALTIQVHVNLPRGRTSLSCA